MRNVGFNFFSLRFGLQGETCKEENNYALTVVFHGSVGKTNSTHLY